MLWFFRRETIHVVCRVPEKPQQRSRSDFLRRHHPLRWPGKFLRHSWSGGNSVGEGRFVETLADEGFGLALAKWQRLPGSAEQIFSFRIAELFTTPLNFKRERK